jgi:hypothetical protein
LSQLSVISSRCRRDDARARAFIPLGCLSVKPYKSPDEPRDTRSIMAPITTTSSPRWRRRRHHLGDSQQGTGCCRGTASWHRRPNVTPLGAIWHRRPWDIRDPTALVADGERLPQIQLPPTTSISEPLCIASYVVGEIVLLDEASGSGWQTDRVMPIEAPGARLLYRQRSI